MKTENGTKEEKGSEVIFVLLTVKEAVVETR